MSSLRNNTILYTLSIGVWTARKLDKVATKEVSDAHATSAKAGRYNKHLLPEAAELEAIQAFAGETRNWFYARTLPWGDNGYRIGRADAHMEFLQEVGERQRQFATLVQAFVDAYPALRESARFELNTLFNDDEYPPPGAVAGKFRFDVGYDVVPAKDDFRILDGVPQEEVDRLVETAGTRAETQFAEALKDAYRRLYEATKRIAEKLAVPPGEAGSVFRDSMMENLRELLDLLPALNITGDAGLAQLADDAEALLQTDLKTLRKDALPRAEAARKAAEIVARFGNMFAGE